MKGFVLLALVSLLFAGCTGAPKATPPTTVPSTDPNLLPTRQVLDKEGNNAQCTDVLSTPTTAPFSVHEGYHTIEVSFHASGVGQVGLEVKSSDGTSILKVPDANPANQPCTHLHSGDGLRAEVKPGNFTVTVTNTGIVGWHLQINEAGTDNATLPHSHS